MPTPKQLATRALARTTESFVRTTEDFPLERWRERPGGEASDLHGVLSHLIGCENWWLMNLGIPEAERPPAPDVEGCQSAQELAALFRQAREHLRAVLEGLPDDFFEHPVPTCEYGNLHSGAELMLYAAEHDFWHIGQIQMLKMALR